MTVAKEEGAGSLWKGLGPGLQRQVIYGGLRIGLYEPVKQACMQISGGGDGLGVKIAAGLLSGAIGITVASPTDLVKVRMQAEGRLPPGVPKKYPSAVGAYGLIVKEEGLAALWTGLGPNIARNAIINAAELASYDQIKQSLLESGMFQDNVYCHLASGLGAGFVAVCVGSPVDVVKSRMMGEFEGWKEKFYSKLIALNLDCWEGKSILNLELLCLTEPPEYKNIALIFLSSPF